MNDHRCTVCKYDYTPTGQRTGPVWGLWGQGYRVCRRCVRAGRDARRDAERSVQVFANPVSSVK